VDRCSEALNSQKKSLNGSKILVLGIAYKNNIDDYRESPALDIIKLLQAKGAEVCFHDSWIPGEIPEIIEVPRCDLDASALAQVDLGVVVTAHDGVDYGELLETLPLIVDTRNAYKGISSPKIFSL
jgi:UDP-N-acetyl-D-glucosamine dehydrogenase